MRCTPPPVVATLLVVILSGLLGPFASADALKIGDTPPDVLGKTSTGEAVHLPQYMGKIVVISFWASWCVPCRKELPLLVAVQKQATREKLIVLSVDWREDYAAFLQLTRAFKDLDVNLIRDQSGRTGDAYGVTAIPHMIIVGRDGKIAAIHIGYTEKGIPNIVNEINSVWSRPPPQDSDRN